MAERQKSLMDTAEAAKAMKVSFRRVLQFIQEGRLPAEQIGGVYVIKRSDLGKVTKRKPGRPKKSRKS